METGTVKTLVYIRTAYELNKEYRLTKFIILVPSIAIKEGVLQSFEDFKKPLADRYGFTPACFEYDNRSKRLRFAAMLRHPDVLRANPTMCGIGVSPNVTQASSLCPPFPKHYFLHHATLFSSTRDLFPLFNIAATRLTGWKPVSRYTGSRPFLTGSGCLML